MFTSTFFNIPWTIWQSDFNEINNWYTTFNSLSCGNTFNESFFPEFIFELVKFFTIYCVDNLITVSLKADCNIIFDDGLRKSVPIVSS